MSDPGAAPGFVPPPRLRLVALAVEPLEEPEVAWLAAELQERLGIRVDRCRDEGAGDAYRVHGAQLDADAAVDRLVDGHPVDPSLEWVLALTAADLLGGGRSFVFGSATMGGAWAIVGTARFGARGDPRYRMRLLRESLHELGHLAGLGHCPDPGCLMAGSATVEEVDRKGDTLCARCRTEVARFGT